MKSLLLSAALLTAPAAAMAGDMHTKGDLHLRTGPSTAYHSILVMPKGASVDVDHCHSNGWCHVEYMGVNGYASGKWIGKHKVKYIYKFDLSDHHHGDRHDRYPGKR